MKKRAGLCFRDLPDHLVVPDLSCEHRKTNSLRGRRQHAAHPRGRRRCPPQHPRQIRPLPVPVERRAGAPRGIRHAAQFQSLPGERRLEGRAGRHLRRRRRRRSPLQLRDVPVQAPRCARHRPRDPPGRVHAGPRRAGGRRLWRRADPRDQRLVARALGRPRRALPAVPLDSDARPGPGREGNQTPRRTPGGGCGLCDLRFPAAVREARVRSDLRGMRRPRLQDFPRTTRRPT
ncbi:MAG: hypothetical protein JWM32_242 [Verrucomicrobia bacterium]|nr:hypothetical protein [Verrucomicrobiota bacterium]